MTNPRAFAGLAALTLLAACGGDENRGGLSAEEDRQLNEAAAMVEENVFDASPDSLVANPAEIEAMEAETAGDGPAEGNAVPAESNRR